MGAGIALGLLVAAGIALLVRHDAGTIAGFDNGQFASIVAAVALLIFIGGATLRNYRGGIPAALRDAVFWGVFALALVAVYSFRDQVTPFAMRIASELLPGMPVNLESGSGENRVVRIRKQNNGQFLVHAEINGFKAGMIIDTGASVVVLTQADARLAGIKLQGLSYTVPMQTANGRTFGARVKLRSVSVGKLHLTNIEALVAMPGTLRESLLGMSFLSRLRSYEFSGEFVTLRG